MKKIVLFFFMHISYFDKLVSKLALILIWILFTDPKSFCLIKKLQKGYEVKNKVKSIVEFGV